MDTHARTGRRWTRLILVLAVLAAVSVPAAVFAAGGHFTDDDDSLFEADINWMADAGVTLGCNPPTNDHYCPDDNVTRGQMAAFMHRLAENQVVDAATSLDAQQLAGEPANYYANPAWGATCTGSTCPDAAATTEVTLLSIPVTAPADGYLTLAYNYSTYGTTASAGLFQTWFTIDTSTDCGSWFFGPLEAVPGSYTISSIAAEVDYNTSSATVVAAVSAGSHTLNLCTLGSVALSSQHGSAAVTFSASGSATPAAAASAADFAYLEDAFPAAAVSGN